MACHSHSPLMNLTLYSSFDVLLKEEKLQNVLGHFQKDFEGGVSAENLGKLKRVQPVV